MAKLWRCEICGDPYIGDSPPDNCPFCGAHRKYIKEARKAEVTFDVALNAADRANVEHALQVEVSNAAFYFCAAEKTDDAEGKLLFKALGKVEAEHANVWRKLLKMPAAPKGNEACHAGNKENLEESHARETKAIDFYRKAASESASPRAKQIFDALVEVETDHLQMSEERLK
jgi:rubrerythrin